MSDLLKLPLTGAADVAQVGKRDTVGKLCGHSDKIVVRIGPQRAGA